MILQLDAKVYGALFKELGENLMKRQTFDLALECWLALHERSVRRASAGGVADSQEDDDDWEEDPDVVYKMGICLHQLKRLPEALESLQWGRLLWLL